MRTFPGIDLDFHNARIVIAGEGFPAVICAYNDPNCHRGTEDDPRCQPMCAAVGSCTLGGSFGIHDTEWNESWDVMIPMENGCLANVEVSADGIHLHLHAPTLDRRHGDLLPHQMMVIGRTVVPSERSMRGAWEWEHVEPEWLAEFLHRLSRFSVEVPKGTRVKLIPISDIRVRPKGQVLT